MASRHQAVALAERALAVADDDPGVLTNAALVLGRTGEDINTIALIDRSLALNPSSARGCMAVVLSAYTPVSTMQRSSTWRGRCGSVRAHILALRGCP